MIAAGVGIAAAAFFVRISGPREKTRVDRFFRVVQALLHSENIVVVLVRLERSGNLTTKAASSLG